MKAKFILVVEDNTALRTVVARTLESLGYLVLTAATFREACDQLAVKPALMILDLRLPDASGWDVAAWLETIAAPVPLIIMTGGTVDAEQVRRFHPVAVLRKPFAIRDLLGEVATQFPLGPVPWGV